MKTFDPPLKNPRPPIETKLDRAKLLDSFGFLLQGLHESADEFTREIAHADYEDMRCHFVGWTDQMVLEELCKLMAKHIHAHELATV